MKALITGGNGFIGANFIIQNQHKFEQIVNLDNLSYAANLDLCSFLSHGCSYTFIKGSITDEDLVASIFEKYQFDCVINFAAESHVDRSIVSADLFVDTNIVGAFILAKCALSFYKKSNTPKFRFLQVSTDEVYGALDSYEPAFTELSALLPNNPYSASKASAEMLVRSFNRTFGLPTLTVNCSNNYGPLQNSEKFIPTLIKSALNDKPLTIYGNGLQIRDWLFVNDNCSAIMCVLENGTPGEKYNIGGTDQVTNIEIANRLCALLDEYKPKKAGTYADQILFVADRLGHDFRYDVDFSKIKLKFGWFPATSLDVGLRATISWYINSHQKQYSR